MGNTTARELLSLTSIQSLLGMGCCLQHVPLAFNSFLGRPETPHQLSGSFSFQAPQKSSSTSPYTDLSRLTLVNTCPSLLLQLKLLRENHYTNAGGVTRHGCQFHLGFQCYLLWVPGKRSYLLWVRGSSLFCCPKWLLQIFTICF